MLTATPIPISTLSYSSSWFPWLQMGMLNKIRMHTVYIYVVSFPLFDDYELKKSLISW